jgi:predicted extracellular nuclease
VLGTSPAVDYRGTPLAYDADVSNPKALNAVLPADVDRSTGVDGSNVFTRAVQVAHFRIAPTTLLGSPSDVWVAANHFTSGPDTSVGQRTEQAGYNAAVVRAIQSEEPNAKVMVAGDLNVYPRPDDPTSPPSDQLHALYDIGMEDLYDTVLAQNPSSAYSYVFEGQAQDLDHQFVTPAFFDRLQAVHEAHVNADWSRVPGSNRGTSDHDPMVSQWGLTTYRGVCELARSYDEQAGAKVCLALDRAEKFAGRGMRKQVDDALDAARHEVAKGGYTAEETARLLGLLGEL